MIKKPFIYICSPLRGDIVRNINKAIGYCRFVYSQGGVPLAPHTIFTRFLDDTVSVERAAGIELGLHLLNMCDELWAFGSKVTEGMAAEISQAKAQGIKVRRFNEKCEEVEETE